MERGEKGLITGCGLVLSHFGEGSRKQGFALHWMLSGSEGDSVVGTLMVLFLFFRRWVAGMKPGYGWDWQRSAATRVSQHRGVLVTVWFGPGSWGCAVGVPASCSVM